MRRERAPAPRPAPAAQGPHDEAPVSTVANKFDALQVEDDE
jgi:hypothetical protein